MLVVGLTGGIGSGKSTAARFFLEFNVPVIDADDVARDVVKPGRPTLQAIVNHFSTDVLTPKGELDRAKLRTIAFADPIQRSILEGLLHPVIRIEIKNRLNYFSAPYCIVIMPLLLETGQQDLVHRILVIDADETMQVSRVKNRSGLTEAEVRVIMAAQMIRQERLSLADDVISNNGDLDKLKDQVTTLHQRYLQLSAQFIHAS